MLIMAIGHWEQSRLRRLAARIRFAAGRPR